MCLTRCCLISAEGGWIRGGTDPTHTNAAVWCTRERAEKYKTACLHLKQPPIPMSAPHQQPCFDKVRLFLMLIGGKLNLCWWSLCLSPAEVFCYSWHTYMRCTRLSFASAAEASGEIHSTTWVPCLHWKRCRISASPVSSVGGKLLIQQMGACDAFSNRCVNQSTD